MKTKNKLLIIILLLIISEIAYFLLYSRLYETIILFAIVSLFNSLAFILVWLILRRVEFKVWILILIITSGLIYRITLLPLQPTASDDIYRYVWDGKVSAHGINPFQYAPSDSMLLPLHSSLLPAKVNHPEMQTIYPPYSQLMFFLSYEIFGENIYGIKILLFISEFLTIFLLFLLLKKLKIPLYNITLYALCPLPIMQFMIDGHIDGTGFPLLLLFLFLYLTGRKINSFIAIGFSIISKFISGLVLPFTFKEEKGKYRFYVILIPILIIVLSYISFFSGGIFPFKSLIEFSENWISNSSIFALIFGIVNDNQEARKIALVLFIIAAGILFFSRKDFLDKIYIVFFLFFLFSPTVHPWYITWLAVLLPLSFRWSGLAFITLVNVANILLINYILNGIWIVFSWIHLIEYLPVISIFLCEILLRNKKPVEFPKPSG
jgi:alpha-1,6-mannosyltransferase